MIGFGDNLNSIIENPAHVYTSPGYYDISLIAKDNFGVPTPYKLII